MIKKIYLSFYSENKTKTRFEWPGKQLLGGVESAVRCPGPQGQREAGSEAQNRLGNQRRSEGPNPIQLQVRWCNCADLSIDT